MKNTLFEQHVCTVRIISKIKIRQTADFSHIGGDEEI